ncbi:MAG: polysaccharide deacetylase family protein [Deltaproteobacteria bacterium]|nr:polysaccharide deacetylase family protein [Deltaproteobacteria bacterium]
MPSAPFLFSIDLEDIRQLIPDGNRLSDRVEVTTERYLRFLSDHGSRCTFFTTGDVARRYPMLVKQIDQEGHEVACHSDDHTPLDRHDPESLREDLLRCFEAYAQAGVGEVKGFRAPIGSMTGDTRWAYDVLRELGFRYSASVLAAASPLYGWPEFGPDHPRREGGLWEFPVSLASLLGMRVPFMGGVYFRVLPFPLVRWLFRARLARELPVVAYFHPYDVDVEQERFMYPEIGGNRFYNWLMYRNRDQVLPRLDRLMRLGARIVPFADHVEELECRAAGV